MLESLAPLPSDTVDWPTLESTPLGESIIAVDEADIRYSLEVIGLDTLGLMVRFRALSELHKGRGEPSNVAQIRRRTTADIALITQLLESLGYYDGTAVPTISAGSKVGSPTNVTLRVEPGQRYVFDQVEILSPPGADLAVVTAALGIKQGVPVNAESFAASQAGLRERLANAGYPFPEIAEPDIVVDHETHSAGLRQAIDPGIRARFGQIRNDGNSVLSAAHIQDLVRFKIGDLYRGGELEDIRRALIATGLYGAVSVRPVDAGKLPDGMMKVDLLITGEAAPQRTVSVTAGYSTTEGARLEASWQHRNLLPPQGAVTFSGVAATREQSIGGELRRSNWRQRDRTLVLSANVSAQQQAAFRATSTRLNASVERETNLIWQKKWYYALGVGAALSNEADLSATTGIAPSQRSLYYIASAPLSLSYDSSDDLLNPHQGFRLAIRATPELSLRSGAFAYVRTQLDGSYYLPLAANVIIAGRLRVGSIVGAARRDIAPSRRFYAGGGGSVRGYDFQQVGPKDLNGVPTGGKALAEAGVEARIRFGQWGVVPFVDVGQVSASTVPDFKGMRVGAGLGLRYYSSFGPIRIDLATPVNPGRGDSRLTFYVAIGQAF